MERTFLMIKPDAVRRGLIGEIIQRVEKTGLKIIAIKMLIPTKERVERFYPSDAEWFKNVGKKTKKAYEEVGLDLIDTFGTTDLEKMGRTIKSWLVNFISSGPVVPMVIEGNGAIKKVRNLVGYTDPYEAQAGTIRGDLSMDSIALANQMKRANINVVHASSNPEEVKNEIAVWFKPEEMVDYKRVNEDLILGRFLKK